jgi:hypothetical protein
MLWSIPNLDWVLIVGGLSVAGGLLVNIGLSFKRRVSP